MTGRGLVLAAVALAVSYGVAAWSDFPVRILVGMKTLPVLLLAVAAWHRGRDRYAATVTAGLVISALADAVIEWRFLGGLALFMAAHVLYIAAFVGDVRRPHWPGLSAVLVIFAAFGLLAGPHLGALRTPVLAYAGVILTMIWRAWSRWPESPRGTASARAGAYGATMFGISDTLLATNRFVAPFAFASLAIMATYWLGQLGIALSVRRSANAQKAATPVT